MDTRRNQRIGLVIVLSSFFLLLITFSVLAQTEPPPIEPDDPEAVVPVFDLTGSEANEPAESQEAVPVIPIQVFPTATPPPETFSNEPETLDNPLTTEYEFYTVTNVTELTNAIQTANAFTPATTVHVIQMTAGVYSLSAPLEIQRPIYIVGNTNENPAELAIGRTPAEFEPDLVNHVVIQPIGGFAPLLSVRAAYDGFLRIHNLVLRNANDRDSAITNERQTEVYNSLLYNNQSNAGGGAILNNGGAGGEVTVVNSTFKLNQQVQYNSSFFGGGVAQSINGKLNFQCTLFDTNSAVGFGGALRMTLGATGSSLYSNYINNTALQWGAIYREAGSPVFNALESYWSPPASSVASQPNSVTGAIYSTSPPGLYPMDCAVPAVPIPPGGSCPVPSALLEMTQQTDPNTITCELETYQMDASSISDEDVLQELLTGVEKTAQALCLFSHRDDADPEGVCDEEAQKQTFINIMIGNNQDEIVVTTDLTGNCDTGPLVIDCFPGATEHTFTHELGHIFLYRTANAEVDPNSTAEPCLTSQANPIVAFIGCMENPTENSRTLGSGPNDTFIFGERGRIYSKPDMEAYLDEVNPENDEGSRKYDVTAESFAYTCPEGIQLNSVTGRCDFEKHSELPTVSLTDWQRGVDGWDGIEFDSFGACDDPEQDYETSDFQQNPCFVPDWLDPELTVTELEEAASDMFLNWVYRSIGEAGFSDNETPPNAPPPFSGGPGDVRFEWMNDQLSRFFDYYGWDGE